ncbi:hypothetical protein [Streptomyces glomeratus]|uniref:hypothetical protein n=1 Tax=Streptomyces glomeratus TaxID=284452 RepID=UPI001F1962F0|nr:hypothetical protein [Streptomyces glomeratus]MCF1512394.1 hypothetical protein [Streptomyces glomeratus]
MQRSTWPPLVGRTRPLKTKEWFVVNMELANTGFGEWGCGVDADGVYREEHCHPVVNGRGSDEERPGGLAGAGAKALKPSASA